MQLMNKTVNFINTLNKSSILESAKKAFSGIKDYFGITKITFVNEKEEIDLVDGYNTSNIYNYDSNYFSLIIYLENNYFDDELISYVKIFEIEYERYITLEKAMESSYVQILTGLPNSAGFLRELSKKKREDLNNYSAIFLNLKNFGMINKAFGQKEGDEAIKEFAKHVTKNLYDDEIASHFGGDNFVFLIRKERFSEFLETCNNLKIYIDSKDKKIEINLSAVLGVYEINGNLNEIGDVITYSSMALQYAKSELKPYIFLTKELKEMLNSAKQIEQTFEKELALNHFLPFYQPKVDIRTGKIIGSEALARWIYNEQILAPYMFIPTLEKSGKIHKLDLYIIECVCKDIKFCHDNGYKTVPVSCNISRKDLLVENFDEIILNIINKYEIMPNEIIIEVTETTNINEQEAMLEFINKMHNNNISTSIDDFGTGYSSLSALRDFKVDEIKIDRSFINREKLIAEDEIIIGSIITMARKLNINVLCEGVENITQANFLERLGCYNVQGFLYDEPLPKEKFQQKLEEGNYHC